MDTSAGALLLPLLLLVAIIAPEVELYTDVYIDGTAVEGRQTQNPYLWFGPRLGRRKRTLDDGALPKNPIEESVISVFEDTPWALVPLKMTGLEDQPGAVGLHLGRDEEEVPDNSKAPPFAPRLGRRRKLLPFSPRLGRELSPEHVHRFERSLPEDHVKN